MGQDVSTSNFYLLLDYMKINLYRYSKNEIFCDFQQYLYNVLNNLTPEEMVQYFSKDYFMLQNIAKLDYHKIQLLLNIYSKGDSYFSLDYLMNAKNLPTKPDIGKLMIKFFIDNKFLLSVNDEDVDLIEVLTLLNFTQANHIHFKYCPKMNGVTREEMIEEISENIILNRGGNSNFEAYIKDEVIEMLSGIYQINPKFCRIISSLRLWNYLFLMKTNNNLIWNVNWIIGNNYFTEMLVAMEDDKKILSYPYDSNVSTTISLSDIYEYNETVDMLTKIKTSNSINSPTFIECLEYAKKGFIKIIKNSNNDLNNNLQEKLYNYRKFQITCNIIFYAAEKYTRSKNFMVAEELYAAITDTQYTKSSIGSMTRYLWCVKRYLNITKNAKDKNFCDKCFPKNKVTIMNIEDGANYTIINKIKNVTHDLGEKDDEIEEITLNIFMKFNNLDGNKRYFYFENNGTYFKSIENAVIAYFGGSENYTNGGIYRNSSIWKEALYLIFGHLFLGSFDNITILEMGDEMKKLKPQNQQFVDFYKQFLIDICNTFLDNEVENLYKFIEKNIQLYWKVVNVDLESSIFPKPPDFLNFLSCINIRGFLLLCTLQMIQPKSLFPSFPEIVLWNTERGKLFCFLVLKDGEKMLEEQEEALKYTGIFLNAEFKSIKVQIKH